MIMMEQNNLKREFDLHIANVKTVLKTSRLKFEFLNIPLCTIPEQYQNF